MGIILTAAEMKTADEKEISSKTPSRTLMERAARAALALLKEHFPTEKVLFLCGGGNNGGDGLAMARFFAEEGGNASVCYAGAWKNGAPDTERMSVECARQLSLLPAGIPVQNELVLDGVSAIADALFGIGLTRSIEGETADLIQRINASGIPVLAVDIPSGVDADTGKVRGAAIRAMHTVTMAAYKRGHFLFPGTLLCGKVHLADIGIPVPGDAMHLLEECDLSRLPTRPARAHKGTFGRVLVIGGSIGMSGAAYLAAKAAYRAGAGLVEIFAPEANRIIYQTQLPEALLTLYDPENLDKNALRAAIDRADAIAIGMGLGNAPVVTKLVDTVLTRARVPVLADADALNELSRSEDIRARLSVCKAPLILTPHLGEMARLLGSNIPQIASDPVSCAQEAARRFAAITVLKDARTVITDGAHLSLNVKGNSGMATGGSGDVLAGVIAALLAAGASPLTAAELGVLTHAMAGDFAQKLRGSHGLMASDIIDALSCVLS